MVKLQNKTAVVTGGNSGIGYATAARFKELGARVILTGRNQEKVEQAAKELGVTGIVADQASLTAIDELVRQVREEIDALDVLFINAGVSAFAAVDQVSEAHFDQIMDVNFKGAFFTLQKFLPLLREGSSVIHLSSINAYTGMPNTAVYAASKAALNSLTRTLSTELAPRGIRVNSVNPGPVKTPILEKLGVPEEALKGFTTTMQNRVPLKRLGAPEDIANLVAFLASDDGGFITGAEYNIDGGVMVNPILN